MTSIEVIWPMRFARDSTSGNVLDADLLSTAAFLDAEQNLKPVCLECGEELHFSRAAEVPSHFREGRRVRASSHPPHFAHSPLSVCSLTRAGARFPFRNVALPKFSALCEKAHMAAGESVLPNGHKFFKLGDKVGIEVPSSEPLLKQIGLMAKGYMASGQVLYPLWIWPISALGKGLEKVEQIKREEYWSKTYTGLWESLRIAGLGLTLKGNEANKVLTVDVAGTLATIAVNKYDFKTGTYRLFVVEKEWIPSLRIDPFHDEKGKVLGSMLRPVEPERPEERNGQVLSIRHGQWRVEDARFIKSRWEKKS